MFVVLFLWNTHIRTNVFLVFKLTGKHPYKCFFSSFDEKRISVQMLICLYFFIVKIMYKYLFVCFFEIHISVQMSSVHLFVFWIVKWFFICASGHLPPGPAWFSMWGYQKRPPIASWEPPRSTLGGRWVALTKFIARIRIYRFGFSK